MTKYICNVCSWIYDPSTGEPSQDIPPGVPFEKLPDSFLCPDCGVGKDQFSPLAD